MKKSQITKKDAQQVKQDAKNLRIVTLGTIAEVKRLYGWNK